MSEQTDPELLRAIATDTYGAVRCEDCGHCFWAVGMDEDGPWEQASCPECGAFFDLGNAADSYYSLAEAPR
jgi:DNA-directed RNA polymerase subunit RPC12/RpoP